MAVKREIYNEGATPLDHMDEIYQFGMEAAFNEMDPERFKAKNEKEKKVFLEGYKKGLEIQKANLNEESNKLAA